MPKVLDWIESTDGTWNATWKTLVFTIQPPAKGMEDWTWDVYEAEHSLFDEERRESGPLVALQLAAETWLVKIIEVFRDTN